MMKNTGYILALCLTASGHVLAHDVWITGKQAENNVIAEIGYGHNFPSKGTIPDRRDFFETPRLYNGKETITLKRKRTARAVLTGMCYSAGSAMRHGSSSLTRLTGQSAMTPSTWRR